MFFYINVKQLTFDVTEIDGFEIYFPGPRILSNVRPALAPKLLQELCNTVGWEIRWSGGNLDPMISIRDRQSCYENNNIKHSIFCYITNKDNTKHSNVFCII